MSRIRLSSTATLARSATILRIASPYTRRTMGSLLPGWDNPFEPLKPGANPPQGTGPPPQEDAPKVPRVGASTSWPPVRGFDRSVEERMKRALQAARARLSGDDDLSRHDGGWGPQPLGATTRTPYSDTLQQELQLSAWKEILRNTSHPSHGAEGGGEGARPFTVHHIAASSIAAAANLVPAHDDYYGPGRRTLDALSLRRRQSEKSSPDAGQPYVKVHLTVVGPDTQGEFSEADRVIQEEEEDEDTEEEEVFVSIDLSDLPQEGDSEMDSPHSLLAQRRAANTCFCFPPLSARRARRTHAGTVGGCEAIDITQPAFSSAITFTASDVEEAETISHSEAGDATSTPVRVRLEVVGDLSLSSDADANRDTFIQIINEAHRRHVVEMDAQHPPVSGRRAGQAHAVQWWGQTPSAHLNEPAPLAKSEESDESGDDDSREETSALAEHGRLYRGGSSGYERDVDTCKESSPPGILRWTTEPTAVAATSRRKRRVMKSKFVPQFMQDTTLFCSNDEGGDGDDVSALAGANGVAA